MQTTTNEIPIPPVVRWHVTPIYEGGESFGATAYYPLRKKAYEAARTLLATGQAVSVLVERHTGTECRTYAAFGNREAIIAGNWIERLDRGSVPIYDCD